VQYVLYRGFLSSSGASAEGASLLWLVELPGILGGSVLIVVKLETFVDWHRTAENASILLSRCEV
jgi:hypothetical protein